MANLRTPTQFKTRSARIVMGVAGLFLVYAIITRALDTGSWWQYLAALVLFTLSIRLLKPVRKSSK